MQRVDAVACLFDILVDGLGEELLHELLEVARAHLAGEDLDHLLADLADLQPVSTPRAT